MRTATNWIDRIRQLETAATLAQTDVINGVDERHKTNSGAVLARRVREMTGITSDRQGDPAAYRKIYTAYHWTLRLAEDQRNLWTIDGKYIRPQESA